MIWSLTGPEAFIRHEPVKRIHGGNVKVANHRAFRECLRLEFCYQCAYCCGYEREVAAGAPFGSFEVDHFRPQKCGAHPEFAKLSRTYSNLYWSCALCNREKRNKWPSTEEEELGIGWLDPCADVAMEHLALGLDLQFVAKTAKGSYTIEELSLNSPAHLYRRHLRRDAWTRVRNLTTLIETTAQQPEHGAFLSELDAMKRRFFDLPGDAVADCLCSSSTLLNEAKKKRRQQVKRRETR